MKTQSYHTPGPWLIDENQPDAVVSPQGDGFFNLIADCHGNPDNAALIAAAPDLLAALEAIARECERQGDTDYTYEIGRTARAAIAAAKGGGR